MQIEYRETQIQTCRHVYEPSEDTFLLLAALESLDLKESDVALEIGTGTGIVAISVAKIVKHVVAVDINPYAVECARKNAQRNRIENIEIIESDLFLKVSGKYDVIIFNPPYLPTGKDEKVDDAVECAWDGGRSGRRVTDKFLEQAPSYLTKTGKIIILDSSRSKYQKTICALKRSGFSAKIVKQLNLFFEELVVIMAERQKQLYKLEKQKRHL